MLIKVKVFPNSKKEEIIKKSEDSFKVKTKERSERGLASKAVVEALSYHLRIPKSKIRLIKGSRKRNKIFEITKV